MTVGELLDTGWVTDQHLVRIRYGDHKGSPAILEGHWYEEKIRRCREMEISCFDWDEDSVDIIAREKDGIIQD